VSIDSSILVSCRAVPIDQIKDPLVLDGWSKIFGGRELWVAGRVPNVKLSCTEPQTLLLMPVLEIGT
jgi:hypothetical protein